MARRWNPRLFLVIGIGSLVVAGASLIGCIVIRSLGQPWSDWWWLEEIMVDFFGPMGCLGVWQYHKVRALNKKLDNLEKCFERREVFTAK
jgi:hypothetical protein